MELFSKNSSAIAWCVALLSSIVICIVLWKHTHQPTWVCVDLQAMVRDAIGEENFQSLSDEALTNHVMRTIEACRERVKQYAIQHRLRVLPKSVVLSPLPDITQYFMGKSCRP
ncbi:MAG: hypothetical protein ACRCYP_05705 [Alphaproteobacteria bacterium]